MTHIDSVRKCVVFVAAKTKEGKPHYLGSAFFLAKASEELAHEDEDSYYVVTARHVVEKAQQTLAITEIWLRLNGFTEPLWASVPTSAWHYHPTNPSVDVAVAHVKLPPKLDHVIVGR